LRRSAIIEGSTPSIIALELESISLLLCFFDKIRSLGNVEFCQQEKNLSSPFIIEGKSIITSIKKRKNVTDFDLLKYNVKTSKLELEGEVISAKKLTDFRSRRCRLLNKDFDKEGKKEIQPYITVGWLFSIDGRYCRLDSELNPTWLQETRVRIGDFEQTVLLEIGTIRRPSRSSVPH